MNVPYECPGLQFFGGHVTFDIVLREHYPLWFVQDTLATTRSIAGLRQRQHEIETLVALFGQCCCAETEQQARAMTARFPHDGFGWKALGAVLKRLRRLGETILPLGRAAEPAQREDKIREQLEALLATEADRQRAKDLGP